MVFELPLRRPLFQEFSFRIFVKSLDLTTSNYDERVWVNFLFMHYSTMVEENFEFLMSEMSKKLWIITNQTPPRQRSENSNSSPKPFLPGHFEKWLPPQAEPFEKWWFLAKILGEKWHYVMQLRVKLNYKRVIFMVLENLLRKSQCIIDAGVHL